MLACLLVCSFLILAVSVLATKLLTFDALFNMIETLCQTSGERFLTLKATSACSRLNTFSMLKTVLCVSSTARASSRFDKCFTFKDSFTNSDTVDDSNSSLPLLDYDREQKLLYVQIFDKQLTLRASQMPPAKNMFGRLIKAGINIKSVIQLMPRVLQAYERGTNNFNEAITKQFNACLKRATSSIKFSKRKKWIFLPFLADLFIRKLGLKQIVNVRQGDYGLCFGHIFGKSLSIYEENVLLASGYYENHVPTIETHQVPIIPGVSSQSGSGCLFYCLEMYKDVNRSLERMSKCLYKRNGLRRVMPLMNLSSGILLVSYLVLDKQSVLRWIVGKENNHHKDNDADENIIRDDQLARMVIDLVELLNSKVQTSYPNALKP